MAKKGAVDVVFSTKMAQVRRKLTQMPQSIKESMDFQYLQLALETRNELQDTTPNLTGDLAKGWEVVQAQVPGADVAYSVENVSDKATQPAPSSKGAARTVLDILEYGASGEWKIEPTEGRDMLHWKYDTGKVDAKGKDVIEEAWVPEVTHPGIAPKGFIAAARAKAKIEQAKIGRRLSQEIKKSLTSPGKK